MTQTQINTLIAQRTADRDAAQAALDEALALTPDPIYRYRVDLSGGPVSSAGYTTEDCQINGYFVSASSSVIGQVNPDAQHAGGAIYETSTPTETAPPPVEITVGESTNSIPWSAIIP